MLEILYDFFKDPDSEWKISTTMKRFSNQFTCDICKLDGSTKKKYQASFSKYLSQVFFIFLYAIKIQFYYY